MFSYMFLGWWEPSNLLVGRLLCLCVDLAIDRETLWWIAGSWIDPIGILFRGNPTISSKIFPRKFFRFLLDTYRNFSYLCSVKQIEKQTIKNLQKMKARITFRVETYIEGDTLQEIKSKFENTPIGELGTEFVELVSVDDGETSEDLLNQWED